MNRGQRSFSIPNTGVVVVANGSAIEGMEVVPPPGVDVAEELEKIPGGGDSSEETEMPLLPRTKS